MRMKTLGKIILILAVIVSIAMVVFRYEEIVRILSFFSDLSLWFLFLAILFQVATYLLQGLAFKYLLKIYKKKTSLVELTNAALAYTFINQILPAAGLTAAPLFSALKKGKTNKGEGAVVAVSWFAMYYVTFFIALFVGFIGLFFTHQYQKGQATPIAIAVGVIFVIVFVGYFIVRKKERFHSLLTFVFEKVLSRVPFVNKKAPEMLHKILEFVDELYHASSELKRKKKYLLLPLLFTLGGHVMDLLTLYVLLYNFDVITPIPVLIVGYCLANLVTMVSAVPLGIGVFEASMALAYSGLGVPFEPALVAVFVFRALAFWIILPLGAVSYHHFLHDWGFGKKSKK